MSKQKALKDKFHLSQKPAYRAERVMPLFDTTYGQVMCCRVCRKEIRMTRLIIVTHLSRHTRWGHITREESHKILHDLFPRYYANLEKRLSLQKS